MRVPITDTRGRAKWSPVFGELWGVPVENCGTPCVDVAIGGRGCGGGNLNEGQSGSPVGLAERQTWLAGEFSILQSSQDKSGWVRMEFKVGFLLEKWRGKPG